MQNNNNFKTISKEYLIKDKNINHLLKNRERI